MRAYQMIFEDLGDWLAYTVLATLFYLICKQIIQHLLNYILNTHQPNSNIVCSSNPLSDNDYPYQNNTMPPSPLLTQDELDEMELLAPPNQDFSSMTHDPIVMLCNVTFGGGIVMDQNLRVVFILEGTKDIFPDYQQLIQQHPNFLDLIDEDDKDQFVQFFQKSQYAYNHNNPSTSTQIKRAESLNNINHSQSIIIHVKNKNKSPITAEIKLTPIYYEDGTYHFMAIRDVGRQSNKFGQAVSQLQNAAVDDESKIDILSHISHELRTPISSIVASVQLFRSTDVTPLQREYLSLIDSSATSLLELISNVLDHDKIGSGKLSLNTVDFNLSTLIEDVCAIVSTQALRKGIEVASYVFTHCPLSIYGDPVRLRQILLNLLSNGIKFTEKGQVLVRVEPLEVCDTSLTLKFEVRDTGMGISKENLPKLFKKYSQFNSKTTAGHGLGLAISKDLVQLMGGQIWCESKPNSGCSFFFTLKFDTPQKQLPCPVPNFNKLNVLIVDPNQAIRGVISDYLREWNCKTVETSFVSKAIKEIRSRSDRQIELLIVDVDSTTLKSFLKLKRMMDIEYSGKIGLIMMSKDRSMVHAIGVGNTSKLTKPIRQSHLIACILASMPECHVQSPELSSSLPPVKRHSKDGILSFADSHSAFSRLAPYYQKEAFAKNIATPYLKSDRLSESSASSDSGSSSSGEFQANINDINNLLGIRRVTRRHSIDIVTFDHRRRYSPQINSILESNSHHISEISPNSSPKEKPFGFSSPTLDHTQASFPQAVLPRSPSLTCVNAIRSSKSSEGGINDNDALDFGNGSSCHTSPPLVESNININHTISPLHGSHQHSPKHKLPKQTLPLDPTILVVDDSSIHLKLVKRVIETSLGLPVVCVSTGKEAIEHFEKNQFALILMDCEMPEVDGYECTTSIRQIESEKTVTSIKSGMIPHVPIIAMTAHSPKDTNHRAKCLSAGMDDIINKPFDIENLQEIVRKWIEIYIERNNLINERVQRLNLIPLRNESDSESASPSDDDDDSINEDH